MTSRFVVTVAPLAGAWIETKLVINCNLNDPVAPLAGAWIETEGKDLYIEDFKVAPLAGAWIETSPHRRYRLY